MELRKERETTMNSLMIVLSVVAVGASPEGAVASSTYRSQIAVGRPFPPRWKRPPCPRRPPLVSIGSRSLPDRSVASIKEDLPASFSTSPKARGVFIGFLNRVAAFGFFFEAAAPAGLRWQDVDRAWPP